MSKSKNDRIILEIEHKCSKWIERSFMNLFLRFFPPFYHLLILLFLFLLFLLFPIISDAFHIMQYIRNFLNHNIKSLFLSLYPQGKKTSIAVDRHIAACASYTIRWSRRKSIGRGSTIESATTSTSTSRGTVAHGRLILLIFFFRFQNRDPRLHGANAPNPRPSSDPQNQGGVHKL